MLVKFIYVASNDRFYLFFFEERRKRCDRERRNIKKKGRYNEEGNF